MVNTFFSGGNGMKMHMWESKVSQEYKTLFRVLFLGGRYQSNDHGNNYAKHSKRCS